jgi:energy-coupling factor transporter ATP-binding protein EcfA2
LAFTHPAAVAVSLKEAVLHAVLERHPDWIALHAAALSSVSGSVLLAGPSGRGKTTLAAVLNALGMSSIADDVALVSVRPSAIRGLPFAFAAKPGSWEVLRTWFPALDELPEFQRPDGRTVKYIEPVRISEQASTVSAVVFPRFSTVTPLRISQMRKVAALQSLLEEAINASRRLTAEGFIALSRLIDGAAVMGMEYDDVNTAAEWIKVNVTQADHGAAATADTNGTEGQRPACLRSPA